MGSLLWITAVLVIVNGQQYCNDNHKKDEIMRKINEYFNHHVEDFEILKTVMEQDIYPAMYMIEVERHHHHEKHHHRRDVMDVNRKAGHGEHDLNHQMEHLRKEMEHFVHDMHHLNNVCNSEILYMIEEKLGLPHLGKTTPHVQHTNLVHHTTHAPKTTHVHHTTHAPKTTTQPPTTTQEPTTTTTTESPTTTLPPLNVSHVCNGLEFVQAAALGRVQVHPDAGLCTDKTNSESEALILNTCHADQPSTWTKGYNVMKNCQRIPKFTPISTFVFGLYPMDGTTVSGVFIKCTATGFQMSIQFCGYGPKLFDVKAGTDHGSRENANNYYTINW